MSGSAAERVLVEPGLRSARPVRQRFTKYEEQGAYHWAHTFGAATIWQFSPRLAAHYLCPIRQAGVRAADPAPVLDLGCGDGVMLHLLAQRGCRAVGLDLEPSGLALARHNLAGSRPPSLLCGDGLRIPLRSGSCRFVSAVEVIEHLPDPSDFLAEVRRVLRPGGVLALTTPNADRLDAVVDPFHEWEFTPEALRELLAAQFREVRVAGALPQALERLYQSATGWRPADLAVRLAFTVLSRGVWNPFVHITTARPDARWALLVAVART